MAEFKFTSVTVALSVLTQIFVPKLLDKTEEHSVNILDYWYFFALAIVLVFLFELVVLLLDKDKADKLRSKFYRVASAIVKSRDNEKKYIINNVSSSLNLARRELDFSNESMPKLVDIQWIDEELEKEETFDLSENQFIVKLSSKDSQQENIVRMASAVTRRTAFSGIRYILNNDECLEMSLDEVIVENLIKKMGNLSIQDYYYCKHLKPLLEDSTFSNRIGELKVIDQMGMFFRILLVELEFYAKRVTGQPYRPLLLGEVEHYIEFLKDIIPEKTKNQVELQYSRAFLKTGIILVRCDKILQEGIDNYVRVVDEIYLRNDYYSFYIIYFERKWDTNRWKGLKSRIDDLAREIRNRITIEQAFDESYRVFTNEGEKRWARCIRFINTNRI